MTPERLDRLRVRYKHVKRELAFKAWQEDAGPPEPMYGFNCAGKIIQTGWWD